MQIIFNQMSGVLYIFDTVCTCFQWINENHWKSQTGFLFFTFISCIVFNLLHQKLKDSSASLKAQTESQIHARRCKWALLVFWLIFFYSLNTQRWELMSKTPRLVKRKEWHMTDSMVKYDYKSIQLCSIPSYPCRVAGKPATIPSGHWVRGGVRFGQVSNSSTERHKT